MFSSASSPPLPSSAWWQCRATTGCSLPGPPAYLVCICPSVFIPSPIRMGTLLMEVSETQIGASFVLFELRRIVRTQPNMNFITTYYRLDWFFSYLFYSTLFYFTILFHFILTIFQFFHYVYFIIFFHFIQFNSMIKCTAQLSLTLFFSSSASSAWR